MPALLVTGRRELVAGQIASRRGPRKENDRGGRRYKKAEIKM